MSLYLNMPLFELFWFGQRNDGRGFRLPLLLGRLHLGLLFAGSSSTTGKKSCDNCSLRSFLFISTILITKCGSSSFPNNRTNIVDENNTSSGSPSFVPTPSYPIKHVDGDDKEFPFGYYHKFQTVNAKSLNHEHIEDQYYGATAKTQHVKTIGYFLKGLILPMLISLTLSFGFIIYKNRVKRARLQAIQNALEEARANPNQIQNHRQNGILHAGDNGFISNALLSFIDARGQWSLIRGNEGPLLESDDYVGEGGETARHKPYIHDLPPDYAAVFDPPSYEEATSSLKIVENVSKIEMDKEVPQLVHNFHTIHMGGHAGEYENDNNDEVKDLLSCLSDCDDEQSEQ